MATNVPSTTKGQLCMMNAIHGVGVAAQVWIFKIASNALKTLIRICMDIACVIRISTGKGVCLSMKWSIMDNVICSVRVAVQVQRLMNVLIVSLMHIKVRGDFVFVMISTEVTTVVDILDTKENVT